VIVWVFSNILAGSDSTAVVLRTLWYNILTSHQTLKRLRSELQTAEEQGKLSMPCAWNEVRDLPYLTACINEAVRMIPPFGLPFERVVPAGGVQVCGQYFKEGTVLGMSAWVVNRHKPTFGDDVDEWRPERWLCEAPKRKVMEQAILTVSYISYVLCMQSRGGIVRYE
jgi:cytochrome P450